MYNGESRITAEEEEHHLSPSGVVVTSSFFSPNSLRMMSYTLFRIFLDGDEIGPRGPRKISHFFFVGVTLASCVWLISFSIVAYSGFLEGKSEISI